MRPGEDPTRFLPRNADAILVVPKVRQLGAKLKSLERLKLASFVAQLQGFANAQEYLTALLSQAGVDLRSEEELIRAGIDPDRGLAVGLLASGFAYTVVPIADLGRFEETVASLARNRLGAGVHTRRGEAADKAFGFSRAADAAPELSVVAHQGFALIGPGDASSQLAASASLALAESFAGDAGLSASLARLPATRDLYVHLSAGSALSREYGIGECTLSAELSDDALRLRADLPRGGKSAAPALLEKKEAPLLLGALPADAFLVARFSGDPLQLDTVWPRLVGPYVAKAFEESNVDVKSELLGNLAPGSVASLSLAPTAILSAMPELDVRRTNPFRFLHLVLVVPVKDVAKADQTLRKIPAVAAGFGAKVEPARRGGKAVYLSSYAQGEGAHFALLGDKVVMAAPLQRLDQALANSGTEGSARPAPLADPALRGALESRAVTAVLDFPQLIRSVKELPAAAWGIGGLAIKATTVRWLEGMDDVRAVTFGAWGEGGAVQAELAVMLTRPEPDVRPERSEASPAHPERSEASRAHPERSEAESRGRPEPRARDSHSEAESTPNPERMPKPEAEGGRP